MMLFRLLTISLFFASWTLMGSAHGAMPTASEVLKVLRANAVIPADVDITYVEDTASGPSRQALRIRAKTSGELRIDTQDLNTGETRTQLWLPETDKGGVLHRCNVVHAYAQPNVSVEGACFTPPPWVSWFLGQDVDRIVWRPRRVPINDWKISLDHDGPVILWVWNLEDDMQAVFERESGALRKIMGIRQCYDPTVPQPECDHGDEFTIWTYLIDSPSKTSKTRKKSRSSKNGDGAERTSHDWPTGLTIESWMGSTRYVLRRRLDSPVFEEGTFRPPVSATPTGKDAR